MLDLSAVLTKQSQTRMQPFVLLGLFWHACLLTWHFLSTRASGGADGPDRIFVGGLPYYLSEEQIIDLLASFG